MAKYGMSLCTLGMAEEFRKDGIAVNSLWPMTSIDTAAVRNVLGGDSMAKMSRLPSRSRQISLCQMNGSPNQSQMSCSILVINRISYEDARRR